MTGEETMQIPMDTRLAEELAEDDVVETANLTTAQTGVPGTIFISTAIGGHEPRVKYFLQPGRSQPAFRWRLPIFRSSSPTACRSASSASGRRRASIGVHATKMRC